MNNSIILHSVNSKIVEQLSENIQVNNVIVPKGYVNLTGMCKAGGKKVSGYLRLKSTKDFLEALKAVVLIDTTAKTGFVIKFQGGNDKLSQGTWGHPNVAVHLAQWISPEFAAWASDVLIKVMKGEYIAVTEEAKKSQKELNEIAYGLITPNLEAYQERLEEVESLYLPGDDRYTSYSDWVKPIINK